MSKCDWCGAQVGGYGGEYNSAFRSWDPYSFSGGITCQAVADIQAGMFAIRARRKVATERDFLDAVEKVIRQGTKFSSTALYAQYN